MRSQSSASGEHHLIQRNILISRVFITYGHMTVCGRHLDLPLSGSDPPPIRADGGAQKHHGGQRGLDRLAVKMLAGVSQREWEGCYVS